MAGLFEPLKTDRISFDSGIATKTLDIFCLLDPKKAYGKSSNGCAPLRLVGPRARHFLRA